MGTTFSKALAPLSQRLRSGVRDIEVLRVVAELDGDDHATSLDAARQQVLKWLDSGSRRASLPLPREAWRFEEFDLFSGGRNRAAVRVTSDDADLWSLRADDPDKGVPGRTWSTEVTIGTRPGSRPLFSAQLVAN